MVFDLDRGTDFEGMKQGEHSWVPSGVIEVTCDRRISNLSPARSVLVPRYRCTLRGRFHVAIWCDTDGFNDRVYIQVLDNESWR